MQRDGLEPVSTEATLKGKRDRALLLLGFAGAFRRSEQLGASNGIACSYAGEHSDYSLAAMADDLAAVITLVGGPAVVLGHSIGGMIAQTFARRHADQLDRDVAALILVGTTYTNPTRTTLDAPLIHALKGLLLTPLMYLTIAFSPLVWAMNWLTYINGTQLIATALSGFAGAETRGQLDFATLFFVKAPPGVLARGMLAMFKFDESSSIGNIAVPVLVVPGDRDPVLRSYASEHIGSVIPGATVVALAPAKHMGLMERHAEFDAVIARFIDSHAQIPVRR